MGNPLMYFKRQGAFKLEGTYGTYEALTASEANFKFNDFVLKYVGGVQKRQRSDGLLGYDQHVSDGDRTSLMIKHFLAGKGSSGLPATASLLRACAMSLDTATYTLTSDQSTWKSISAAAYHDGRILQARGLMGSVKYTLNAGQAVEVEYNMLGGHVGTDPADGSMLTGQTFTEAIAPVWGGTGAMTLASSTAFKAAKVEIEINNNVTYREDENAPFGWGGGWCGSPTPKITMDPEATLFATKNWYAAKRAGTLCDLVLVVGSASNNTQTLTCTNLQLEENPDEQNRNDKRAENLSFTCQGFSVLYA